MRKGYDGLLKFTEEALTLYKDRFGEPEGDETENAYDAVREAEKILNESQ
jgi:hypothetical protein